MERQRYSARREFKYNGTLLDRGQVMSLAGCVNDDKFPRLGFLTPLEKGQQLYACRICGAEFISERQRTKHGDRVHDEDPVERAVASMENAPMMTKNQGQAVVNRMLNDPDYEPALIPDETISARDKENNQEAPIFFEKTEASVKAGAGAIEITSPTTPFDEGMKAAGKAAKEGRGMTPKPGENPYIVLTGVHLKKWRTKKHLSRVEASKILGIGISSIARAEKLRKRSLGPQLAPALKKALEQ